MKNSYIRDLLVYYYGPTCWLGGQVTEENYLTLHHIKPVRDGGRTTLENGALLSRQKHIEFNMLERAYPEYAEEINNYFLEYRGQYPQEVYERIQELMSLVPELKDKSQKQHKKSDYQKRLIKRSH